MSDERRVAIKFLLSNALTGSLIGSGGKAIKELMAVTHARIQVSGPTEPYPGSSDRVILLFGTRDTVEAAQCLLWDMLALMAANSAADARAVDWSPQATAAEGSAYGETAVSARFTIPAAAGGAILGKGGAAIQSIAHESGAKISMTSKEEALFTHERIVSISGTAEACKICTSLVIGKLMEGDVLLFFNKGTTYSSPMGGGGYPSRRSGGGGGKRSSRDEEEDEETVDTTITLAVPDELIGNILGKQGSTMREIISLSGANVVVSKRGEYVEGTTNRLVTITGSPTCAQTAHLFITQRLHTPSNPPPRAPRK